MNGDRAALVGAIDGCARVTKALEGFLGRMSVIVFTDGNDGDLGIGHFQKAL